MSVPAGIAIVAALVLLLVVLRVRAESRSRKVDPDLERLVKEGNYEGAAQRAHVLGNDSAAVDFLVRGQKPGKAAALAQRMGRLREAAELYEKAEEWTKAVKLYRQCDMPERAAALEPRLKPEAPAAPVPAAHDAARSAQAAFDTARQRKVAAHELAQAGQKAAEAWLDSGDVRRAADASRDAGLVEQAVNLYANLLGEPAAAAQVLATAGEHRRAAELYGVAGQAERATSEWIAWSRDSADPFEHLADLKRLGRDRLLQFIEAVARARPGDRKLQQRIAAELGGGERPEAAAPQRRTASSSERPAVATERPEAAAPPRRAASSSERPAVGGVERAEFERMVNEAAVRAVSAASHKLATSERLFARRGVEKSALSLDHAMDAAVRAAKRGPSPEDLERELIRAPFGEGSVEIGYKLGLALVAAGEWERAEVAFAQVAAAAPDFRDVQQRIDEIERWKHEVGGSQTVGRYSLVGELGRGGMAVVYRARDELLARDVALKFLADEAQADPMVLRLFRREAQAVAALSHPNIVTVYDVGALDGRPFICMELVDGVTVEQLLETQGRLKVLDALHVAEQALSALEYAHGKNIIHRDVKPANLMQSRDGVVKLMDFGLARSIGDGKSSTVIAGTPAYMAPERLAGSANDPRSDLFAIGASLYEMLTGRLPFEGLRRDAPPPPARDLNPTVPRLLDVVIARALAFAPERRFATATEMLTPLRQILGVARSFLAQHKPAPEQPFAPGSDDELATNPRRKQ